MQFRSEFTLYAVISYMVVSDNFLSNDEFFSWVVNSCAIIELKISSIKRNSRSNSNTAVTYQHTATILDLKQHTCFINAVPTSGQRHTQHPPPLSLLIISSTTTKKKNPKQEKQLQRKKIYKNWTETESVDTIDSVCHCYVFNACPTPWKLIVGLVSLTSWLVRRSKLCTGSSP